MRDRNEGDEKGRTKDPKKEREWERVRTGSKHDLYPSRIFLDTQQKIAFLAVTPVHKHEEMLFIWGCSRLDSIFSSICIPRVYLPAAAEAVEVDLEAGRITANACNRWVSDEAAANSLSSRTLE
jgi:hypothetical protein